MISRISDLATPTFCQLDDNLWAMRFELMKVLPAWHTIKLLLASHPGLRTIVETTSGTCGLAEAYVCKELGLELVLASDPAIDQPLRNRIENLGARVLVVPNEYKDREGGFQRARLEIVHEILREDRHAVWTNQYSSPNWPLAYAAAAGDLLANGLEPDIIVAACGSGASGCGIHQALGMVRDVRLYAVDTPGSVLFGAPEARRDLRGLGNSIIPGNLNHSQIDGVFWVVNSLAVDAAHQLCSLGLDVGPTSGAAWIAARTLAAQHPARQVVFICPDSARRYPLVDDKATLADLGWLGTHVSASPVIVNHPSQLKLDEPLQAFPWNRRTLAEVATDSPTRQASLVASL